MLIGNLKSNQPKTSMLALLDRTSSKGSGKSNQNLVNTQKMNMFNPSQNPPSFPMQNSQYINTQPQMYNGYGMSPQHSMSSEKLFNFGQSSQNQSFDGYGNNTKFMQSSYPNSTFSSSSNFTPSSFNQPKLISEVPKIQEKHVKFSQTQNQTQIVEDLPVLDIKEEQPDSKSKALMTELGSILLTNLDSIKNELKNELTKCQSTDEAQQIIISKLNNFDEMLKNILSSYNQFNSQLKNIEDCFKSEFGAMSELFEKTFEKFDDTNNTIIRRIFLTNKSVMVKMEKVNKKIDGMKESIKKELIVKNKPANKKQSSNKPPFITSVKLSNSFNVHSHPKIAPVNHTYNTRQAINFKHAMEIEKALDTPSLSSDNMNRMLENFINMPTQKHK